MIAAYFGIFSEFAPYDDEGTLLITLKAFVHGDALYSEIWSVYGPFYYELFGGFFKLFGLSVTTDASRTIVLVLWVGTSLLFGVDGAAPHRPALARPDHDDRRLRRRSRCSPTSRCTRRASACCCSPSSRSAR